MRRSGIDGLKNFLELPFGILVGRRGTEAVEQVSKEPLCQGSRCIHATIEENGTGDGFEGIGEGGVPLTASVTFLTATHKEKIAELNPASHLGESFGRDELSADFGQHSFVGSFVAQEKHLREEKLEHGIAEELEALIVRQGSLALIAEARMGECLGKQRGVPE